MKDPHRNGAGLVPQAILDDEVGLSCSKRTIYILGLQAFRCEGTPLLIPQEGCVHGETDQHLHLLEACNYE